MAWFIGAASFFGIDFIVTMLFVYLYKKFKKKKENMK